GLLIAGFVVFASLILLGLSAYWLTNRLASLARSSRAIAAGNYTLQLPERGRDEVAQLSGSFNEMRRSIQQQLNELGANELEYRALFEQAAVGMGHLCIDDGHWLRANNKLCLLLNQPPEAFTRQTIFDIALEEDRERLREARHALLQGEIDVFETDCQLRRSDGSLLWCTVTASLYRKPGGTAGYFILLVQDVSARKANEIELDQYRESLEQRVAQRTADLAAANNELRAFSYSVSHDLRAPLRSIDGFSHMLEEDYGDRLDDIARGYMGRIRAAAQRMGSLIDAMLNLAKVTRAELQPKLVDLSALARGIVDDLQAGQPARTVEVDIEGWLYAWGDEELLRSAMQNLLGNAWKYSARREQARIEFGRLFAEDGPVFFVRDNGAGFDARYADKLFAPFQRLHSASDFDGIGVGLASVQRVVQRHAGRIWAEAEPDKGATFFFTLRIEPELSAANSADTHTQAGTPP
ncbi:ATP-binding protein, partial [Chitinimonas sp.]|uniref:sensor histidine kinase n=1 Tax=Chitinimonas sp. TaxID=1934313 RepID=UPI0035B0024C